MIEKFSVPVNDLGGIRSYDILVADLQNALAEARETATNAQIALVQAQEELMRVVQEKEAVEALLAAAEYDPKENLKNLEFAQDVIARAAPAKRQLSLRRRLKQAFKRTKKASLSLFVK